MYFILPLELAKELQELERIPAIRHLRQKCSEGVMPPLHVCRDIVDKIHTRQYVERDFGVYASPSVLVEIGE